MADDERALIVLFVVESEQQQQQQLNMLGVWSFLGVKVYLCWPWDASFSVGAVSQAVEPGSPGIVGSSSSSRRDGSRGGSAVVVVSALGEREEGQAKCRLPYRAPHGIPCGILYRAKRGLYRTVSCAMTGRTVSGAVRYTVSPTAPCLVSSCTVLCCTMYEAQQCRVPYRVEDRLRLVPPIEPLPCRVQNRTVCRRLFVVRVNCVFLYIIGAVGSHRGGGSTGAPLVVAACFFRFFFDLPRFGTCFGKILLGHFFSPRLATKKA